MTPQKSIFQLCLVPLYAEPRAYVYSYIFYNHAPYWGLSLSRIGLDTKLLNFRKLDVSRVNFRVY